jgi:hypothetical protein
MTEHESHHGGSFWSRRRSASTYLANYIRLQGPQRSTVIPLVVFLAITVGFVVLQTTLGRSQNSTDEVFFKAAGREWAATGRFGAPELVNVFNRTTNVTEVFFLFVPVYPFLFGLVVSMVSFGWRTCVFYDAGIAAVLAAITFWAIESGLRSKNRWMAALGGLAMLPLNTPGRPDALATCFGMVSIMLLWSGAPSAKRLIMSGIALGLCAGTSPSAAVLMGLVGLNRIAWWRVPLHLRISRALVWGLIAFGTLGVVVAPILVPQPSSFEQFSLNANHTVGATGQLFTVAGMLRDLLGVGQNLPARLVKLFIKVGLLAGLASAVASIASREFRDWLELWLGPIVGFGLLLTILSHNPIYYHLLAPLYMIGSLHAIARFAPVRPRIAVLLSVLLVCSWFASGFAFWRDIFVLSTLPTDQQPGYQARHLPRVVSKGSTVFGHGCWWFLGDSCRVIDVWWAHPEMSAIDYVVLETGEVFKRPTHGDGSSLISARDGERSGAAAPIRRESAIGAGRSGERPSSESSDWCSDYVITGKLQEPELSHVCRSFRVVEDRTYHELYKLFGRPLFDRQKGFGCLVLKRTD